MPRLSMRRSTLALDLWQYGEEAAADAAFRISSEDFERICERTYELASDIPDGAQRGMMFAKAGALAGIEVIEGSPRPLARNRRRVVPLPSELVPLAEQEEAFYRIPFAERDPKAWPGVSS